MVEIGGRQKSKDNLITDSPNNNFVCLEVEDIVDKKAALVRLINCFTIKVMDCKLRSDYST
jgi:hypothetical protein